MRPYLDLLRDVRENGVRRPTRAVLESTGQNIDALSVFGRQVRYDLSEGFPLVTTKKVNFDAIVHELIWFLRGETNVKYLNDNGVHIWDAWKNSRGNIDWAYGQLWRRWPGEAIFTKDQISRLFNDINGVISDPSHPAARRLLVTAWNPSILDEASLPACHALFQFDVDGDRLSCQLYQRSADLFLGVPYNIASYALLIHLLAGLTGLKPGEFIHSIGNAHVYVNHLDQVDEQLSRNPLTLPKLRLDLEDAIRPWNLTRDRVFLDNYNHHPALRGEVAV